MNRRSWLHLMAAFLLAASACALFAAPAPAKVKVLIITGVDYPGHLWRETTPAIVEALKPDPRIEVTVVQDPWFLDSAALDRYNAIVLHFQNWQQPGPAANSKENLRRFVEKGGGLALVHFACGAWHGEWPEFVKLAGRVWAGPGPEVRQHDPFGPFAVEILDTSHPITRGVNDFATTDELYTCLMGDTPIQVLAQAKSKVDSQHYPMVLVSQYGQGRTFLSTLGHDAAAIRVPAVSQLFRRGIAWASGIAPAPAETLSSADKPTN